MPDFITCPICQSTFNPAYLDQVIEHMHEGVKINQIVKGERAMIIKATELRIGNLMVDFLTGAYLKISEITDHGKIVTTVIDKSKFPLPDGWQMMPIPLTPEILEKCGFEKSYDGIIAYLIKSHRFYLSVDLYNNKILIGDNSFREMGSSDLARGIDNLPMMPLHQLQNLYFALIQQELNVNL